MAKLLVHVPGQPKCVEPTVLHNIQQASLQRDTSSEPDGGSWQRLGISALLQAGHKRGRFNSRMGNPQRGSSILLWLDPSSSGRVCFGRRPRRDMQQPRQLPCFSLVVACVAVVLRDLPVCQSGQTLPP
jgi:hypothetical protein